MSKFFFQKQHDTIDCGPSCLKMIAGHYGKKVPLEHLRDLCYLSREGVSIASINDAAEKLGFRTFLTFLDSKLLADDAPLPAILHWNQDHFVVLYDVRKGLLRQKKRYVIADPAHGVVSIDEQAFRKGWVATADNRGAALLLEPTPSFYGKRVEEEGAGSLRFLLQYLLPYKKYLLQLAVGMLAASLLTLLFPVLTQILIDNGVSDRNLPVVLLVLTSQLFLFLGSTLIGITRSWLLLHINTRISLNIISDFLVKLLRLPIRYFDTKAVGDLSQRINDHHRIEGFLTGDALGFVFSIINIAVFLSILAWYDWKILAVFVLLSGLGVLWILLFQKRRKTLDYHRFARNKENQDKLYEMITGMQEIKLYGSETAKRMEWEDLQVKSFRLNMKSLALEQYQQSGYTFFNHLKNILVSYLAARQAIDGQLTLGALLSISYIIGQTNGPLEQLVWFIKSAQDARLSMERLQEVHQKRNEEEKATVTSIPGTGLHEDIVIENLSFQYEGPHSPLVLQDINLVLPKGKVTAIVGTSGSGKTTLMKMLLGFYEPSRGRIRVGGHTLADLSPRKWRSLCGSVMQDGYLFFDTIARNIAMDGSTIDEQRMDNAVATANLTEFIGHLPLGFGTKIGNSGIGISGGQKQRILIARAVYKNPDYLFFDEATSSLDANNERVIMRNLNKVFEGKTVLVIAHRLSTVRHADQIIVLEGGRIAETGHHDALVAKRGRYYELVKNQLELGT